MIMYMCMCHQVSLSLISCLKSQFPLITNISPKQNPDLLHLFIWGTSIRGLQYPRRSRWALIFMLWEVSEKICSCCEPWNQSETYAKCCKLLESINESCWELEFFGSTSYSFHGDVEHHDHLLRRVIQLFFWNHQAQMKASSQVQLVMNPT